MVIPSFPYADSLCSRPPCATNHGVENATVYAPDLPRGFPWLNTPRPLTLRELRGRLVMIHFWTYSSIESVQMLTLLRSFEWRHRNDPIVVIGVHSARFDAERDVDRVEDAVRRHDVRHPVVVDSDLQLWRAYGVQQWPSLVIVRPDSTMSVISPGEPSTEALERFVQEELRRGRDKGQLTEVPLQYLSEQATPMGPLSFPTRAAVARDGQLAISDTGNHRVLVFDSNGLLSHVIGGGEGGHRDGSLTDARFEAPHGVVFDAAGRLLFIADPGNHTVRRVDLDAQRVSTLSGTGALGEAPLRAKYRGAGATTALRSPTGLTLDGQQLFVTLAGSHQLATIDARTGETAWLAGTSEMTLTDGAYDVAAFAQPTGLALKGRTLFVADSDSSAIRRLELDKGTVETVVGSSTFDFGYEDGPKRKALLQRCLDVAVSPDGHSLLVADTLNGKLRQVSIASGETSTVPLTAANAALCEPSGIAMHPGRGTALLVDTSHHRLLEVSLDGRSVRAFALGGIPDSTRSASDDAASAQIWLAPLQPQPISLRDGDSVLLVRIASSEGVKLAADGVLQATAEVTRKGEVLSLKAEKLSASISAPLTVPLRVARTHVGMDAELLLRLELPLASDMPRASLKALVRVPLRLGEGGAAEAPVDVSLDRLPR